MPTNRSLLRGAALAVLVFLLLACGSDEVATDVGAGDGEAESTSTSVAEASTEEDEDHDDDADHDEDADHDADHDDDADHDEDEDEDHDDHDDEDADHGDEDHDDEDADHDDEDHDDHDHDDEDGSSGLGAHEHGAAELSVAWNDGDVVIDLISPTFNIFGFEYEATTDEDKELVAERLGVLAEPEIMALNSEAQCELVADVATELEYEGSHAELTASWLLTCSSPDEIRELDVAALFAEFPNLEDIDAQWASPSGQSAAELSPSSTVLSLG